MVLRWLTQRGVVVIPRSVRPERMAENIDVFDVTLTEDQLTQVAGLDLGVSQTFDHRGAAEASAVVGQAVPNGLSRA